MFMSDNLQQYLSEISSKIKKIKLRNQRLEAENEELRKSVFTYLQQLDAQKREIEKLTESATNASIGNAISKDKKILHKEIDKYILMIDKCIAGVNSKL